MSITRLLPRGRQGVRLSLRKSPTKAPAGLRGLGLQTLYFHTEYSFRISSSDDDDDIILGRVNKSAAGTKRASREPDRRERKRQRSRSKSITPPPELPEETLQNARERVRRMLNQGRAQSPTYVADESVDNLDLDPELAKIAAQVKHDAERQRSVDPIHSRGVTPAMEGGPETVTIKVKWKYHPLNQADQPQIWGFKMKRHDSFKLLFDEVADMAEVLVEHIIVSYNGKRVFPSASPHGIGVWMEAELEACEKTTYEYIKSQRRRSPSVIPQDGPHHPLSPTFEEPEETEKSEAEANDNDDKFKLTLRGKDVKNVTLTVRPTTKCSAIIKAFLKSAGLSDKYPATAPTGRGKKSVPMPQLMVDGDKLNPNWEIGKADLEDGDLVEVVGL
ncbi:unnamed protein product [Somion occarium]|uniref:Rad60/SUMO-like domain-containing protein n=1 Tax=Somion occarium TaxID=3059160 RepID=A0ABP1DXA2_9APHY